MSESVIARVLRDGGQAVMSWGIRQVRLRGVLAFSLQFSALSTGSLFALTVAAGEPFQLESRADGLFIGPQVEVLRDPGGELTADKLLTGSVADRFEVAGSQGLNYGFTSTPYWYRFALTNPMASVTENWVMEIAWPPLDELDIYISRNAGLTAVVKTGDQRPPGSAGIVHRNYAVPLQIKPGETVNLLLRAQIEGSHQVPIQIWAADAFFDKTTRENLLYGMFYGAIAVMVIYNLLIFISIRDLSYLYFILFIFWLGVLQLSLDGFAFPFLWKISPNMVNGSLALFVALATVFVPPFISRSLQTSQYSPRLNKLLYVAFAVALMSLVFPFVLSIRDSVFINVLIGGLTTVLMAVVIVTQAIRGRTTARYFMAVWGALVLGITAKVMEVNGLLPISVLTTYAIHIGLCFLVTLVSLSLGEQINRERREKDRLAHDHAVAESAAKSEFLAKMSHELRTPMNAIVGFTDLALRSQTEEQRFEHLGYIKGASHSMLRVLNDVLDLTHLESGRLTLAAEPFRLSNVLDQATVLAQAEAAEKGLTLSVQCEPDTPQALIGDAGRLEQILLNLLGNAVKFSDQGKVSLTIKPVSVTAGRVSLRFTVEDTGIGISTEQLSRLFTPFGQADPTLARGYGGSGLGLVICKELVELMGGRIAVDSEPGRGSVFSFELEFDVAAEAIPGGEPEPASEDALSDLNGARVLLAEDNSLNRRLIEEILNPLGVVLGIAENGQQAVEALKSASHDLVLMDLQMPVMDGLEATRQIRALPGLASLPVIALSANSSPDDRQQAELSGMNDFLSKPIDAEQLLLTLSKWLPRQKEAKMNSLDKPTGTTAQPELPDSLPGIELAEAARRIGGRYALLVELLQEFVVEQAQVTQQISTMWQEGRHEDAVRAAHSLKGLAANFGCNELSSAAWELEEALKQRIDPTALLVTVEQALQQVTESVSRIPGVKSAPAEPSPQAVQPFDKQLKELLDSLRRQDFSAGDQFQQLSGSLQERLPPDAMEAAGKAIHAYDFDAASAILRQLEA